MKIGIDGRCLQNKEHTGVQEYTKNLILELLNKNPKDNFIIFVNAFGEIKEDFRWLKSFDNTEIRKFHWPNKILNFCFWFWRWPKIDKMLGGLDVFVIPNFNFFALSKNVKKILTVHDLSFERFPETFSFKRRLWHFLINPRRVSKESDLIWAVSKSTAQDLRSIYKINKDKIKVNYPFFNFDSKITPEEVEKIKDKYNLPDKFFLFLGTVEPRKNIEGLMEGFEIFKKRNPKFKEYKLIVAGERGWLCSSILEKVEISSFADDIRFIGFVNDEDKKELYSLAKVFIYPSLYEGFGFPPLEAMSCGVPTIASNCSSMPEILEDGAMLINPYRPFEICLVLENFLENQELYQLYSQKSLRQSEKIRKIKRDYQVKI
jgi:glycosyltransferase involved in cell wall biosynthesis